METHNNWICESCGKPGDARLCYGCKVRRGRFKARYHGRVLGWYDTADEAQAAIDAAAADDAPGDDDVDLSG